MSESQVVGTQKKGKRKWLIPLLILGGIVLVAGVTTPIVISQCGNGNKIEDFNIKVKDETVLHNDEDYKDFNIVYETIGLSDEDLSKYNLTWLLDLTNERAKEYNDLFIPDTKNGTIKVIAGLPADEYKFNFKCTVSLGDEIIGTAKIDKSLTIDESPIHYSPDGHDWPGRTDGGITCTLDEGKNTASITSNTNLTTDFLNIPRRVWNEGKKYTITSIGDKAFDLSQGLSGSLFIPDTVTTIGDYAFNEYDYYQPYGDGLTGQLTIGRNVTTIGDSAFYNNQFMPGSLVIPNKVTTIGSYAFGSCKSLTSLTIGGNVKTIKQGAFGSCDKIVVPSLIIPNSVTKIEADAFSRDEGIKELIIQHPVSGDISVGKWCFDSWKSDQTIKVYWPGEETGQRPQSVVEDWLGLNFEGKVIHGYNP